MQLGLHDYLDASFATLKAPTIARRGRSGGSVHVAVSSTIDGLRALI